MKAADVAHPRFQTADPEVRLDALYMPFVRRWRLVLLCVGIAWIAALAFILVPKREYKAQFVLAAVPSSKSSSLAGGLASMLGNASIGGVQSTPFFITRLLMLPSVLRGVAHSPVAPGAKQTVIERVLDQPASDIKPQDVEHGMRNVITTDVDKQTGLVTFAVTHSDSALARQIAEKVLASASRTFATVMRTQGSDQRRSGQAQVDSALRQLHVAEARVQDFETTHRVYAPYSPAAMERQRLDRDVATAQAAYQDAIGDRQNAIAMELDDAPAIVIVDPIAPELTPEPRQAVLKLILAAVLGVLVAGIIMAFRGEFSAQADQRTLDMRSAA